MGSGNSIWQSNPDTWNQAENPNTDVWASGVRNKAPFPFGTNTYSNPGFANPNGLPTTAPNCSGYADTTDCMNGRYQIAADLTPSGGAAGLGYQAPGACTPDLYFPTWLKGAGPPPLDRVEPDRKLRFDSQALRHVVWLCSHPSSQSSSRSGASERISTCKPWRLGDLMDWTCR